MPDLQNPLNDHQAFSRFYEQTHISVFRFIYSMINGPVEEAEDLSAETFTKAWRNRNRFSGSEKAALGWTLTIARNLVIDSYRKNKNIQNIELQDEQIDSRSISPEQHMLNQDQLGTLLKVMHVIPIEKREMLILRFVLGWRVKDIGARFDIPENTVSVNIRRSLDTIRSNWPVPQKEE